MSAETMIIWCGDFVKHLPDAEEMSCDLIKVVDEDGGEDALRWEDGAWRHEDGDAADLEELADMDCFWHQTIGYFEVSRATRR